MSQHNATSARYAIRELTFDGILHSASDLIPYSNGQGQLRNILISVSGMYNESALVPITLFNDTARRVDPERDVGREVACIAKLRSATYPDRNGVMRWDIKLTASYLRIKDPEVAGKNLTTVTRDDDLEDLPF